MKGTFFQKPLEFNIEVIGESWSQGDHVKGTLTLKNHGNEVFPLKDIGVTLSLTDVKKFKAKDPKGIVIEQEVLFPDSQTVAAQSSENLDFEFKLGNDCAITEKSSSLYINCGNRNDPFSGGHLQLTVTPIRVINQFLEIFENFFKFKVKGLKNKKGVIDAKLAAPDSKDLGAVEQLNLYLSMEGDSLKVKYLFKTKKLSYEAGNVQAKADKKEFDQILEKKQHTSFGDSPNQDGIQKAIGEIIEQVKSKTLF